TVYLLPSSNAPSVKMSKLSQDILSRLPPYISERLLSICEKLNTFEITELTMNLVRGLREANESQILVKAVNGESKVYLNTDDSALPIIGIWVANKSHFLGQLNGLQDAIQELLVEPLVGQIIDYSDDFSTSFQSALWQLAAVIWNHNCSTPNEQYAIQSKLF
ncbi:MAG: hypothetical protein P8Q94_02470, partial [Candidatus Poseidoniaceae archaeon]|nr:hypothetical protein [Candidatus Poseidoniaceae archaeon]